MKERLPCYAVKCLLAAGYDAPDVISSMNISEEPDNSITIIEKFIDKHFRGHEEYYSNPVLASCPFVFPPGHRIRIMNFVSEVKRLCYPTQITKPKKRRQQFLSSSSYPLSKLVRITEADAKPELVPSVSKITNQVRSSISRWVKAQSCNLKENQHFVVTVSNHRKSGDISAVIRCNACRKDIILHRKNTESPFLLSNWTRHVKGCKQLETKPGKYQQPLGKFITAVETSSCPESDETDTGQASDLSSTVDIGSPKCSSPSDLSGERGEKNNILESMKSETSMPQTQNSQVFWKAPPSKDIGGGALCNGVIDWSRDARAKRLLVKAGSDINQTLITQYYGIVDEIEKLTQSNDILSTLRVQESNVMPFSPVLKQIISNAERNAKTLPHGKRHPEVLKKFATALYIYSGPLAYEFLQRNLHQALPSLRTIQRVVHANYNTINEGEFRFDGLAAHIAKHNTTNMVTVGEDATRIICRVEYDSKTNRCVGFVFPLKGGLPVIDSFLAISFNAIYRKNVC